MRSFFCTPLVTLFAFVAVAAVAACGDDLDLGGGGVGPGIASADAGIADLPPASSALGEAGAPPAWELVSPAPTVETILAGATIGVGDDWYVGEGGVVVRVDKQGQSRVAHRGARDMSYHAIAGTRPDDVWIAGHTAGGRPELLHWDGATFSDEFSPNDVRAIASTTEAVVLGVGGGGQSVNVVSASAGGAFRGVMSSLGVRDVWTDPAGGIYALDVYSADESLWRVFYRAPAATAARVILGRFNDTDPNRVAYALWASARNDLWVAFSRFEDGKICPEFAHDDGEGLRTAATFPCRSFTGRRSVLTAGRQMMGDGHGRILALPDPSAPLYQPDSGRAFLFEGGAWREVETPYLEGFRAVGSTGGAITGFGAAGGVFELAPHGAPEPFRDRFDSVREGLTVATAPDGTAWAWNLYSTRRWNDAAGAWRDRMHVEEGLHRVVPISADRALLVTYGRDEATGTFHTWIDETRGSSRSRHVYELPRYGQDPVGATSSHAFASGEAWIACSGGWLVHREAGGVWSSINVEKFAAFDIYGVHGIAPNDVWFAATTPFDVTKGRGDSVVLHWDGVRITQAARFDDGPGGQIFEVAPNDVWIASDRIRHWNGSAWSTLDSNRNRPFVGVWGRASNDVWFATGRGFMHWDGTAIRRDAFEPPFGIGSMAGGPNGAFAVGEHGMTLRLASPALR